MMESKSDGSKLYIVQTARPHLMATIIAFDPEKDGEKITRYMMQMASGDRDAVRVPGYWIFVQAAGSFSKTRYYREDIMGTLKEMADYGLQEFIKRNYSSYKKSKQTGNEQF